MRHRIAAAVLAIAIAVPAAVAVAQGWLWDVPPEHRQTEDISYALEKGWFTGYPDGSFRPDEVITPGQMLIVLERFGRLTRADTATVLRHGHEALIDLETTDTTAAPWYVQECAPLCVHRDRWSPNEDTGVGGWMDLTLISGRSCKRLTITVTGDSEPWVYENVQPGDTVRINAELPERSAPFPPWSATCD